MSWPRPRGGTAMRAQTEALTEARGTDREVPGNE